MKDIPSDLIEIHDPEIDPVQIMEQIRERLRQRREEKGYFHQSFPSFGAAAYPGEPEEGEYDSDLYYHLRQANERYYQLGVEIFMAPSPRSSVPLIGRLWERLRREAHHLVLFYVNQLAKRQVTINRHFVSTLNRMVVQMQDQQRRIQALEDKLQGR